MSKDEIQILVDEMLQEVLQRDDVLECFSETESADGYGFLLAMKDGKHISVMVEEYHA